MSEKSTFSKNLVKARKLKGWSQRGAAEAIREAGAKGFNRPVLGSYEEDRANPSNETLVIICDVYEIQDMKGFLTDPNFFDQKTSPEELHRRYLSLDEQKRKVVEILLGLAC